MKTLLRVIPLLMLAVSFMRLTGASGAQQGANLSRVQPVTLFSGHTGNSAGKISTLIQPANRAPVTITQSNSLAIGESFAGCGTAPLNWWRAFDLDAIGLTGGLQVKSVDVAMYMVNTNSTLVVNLFTSTQNPPVLASLTPAGTGQITLSPGTVDNTLVNVPVSASLPAGSILVVEAVVPEGNPFIIGYNTAGETGPTYINGCVFTEITDIDYTEAPLITWVMQVNGDDGLATSTPTPTDTPVETATATATSTPVETATATPTEVPQNTELVVNGGFEEAGLTPWTLKNGVGEKVKCNTDTKVVAHTGECAFRFKGGTGENSKIQQIVDFSTVSFAAGDTLDLSLFVNASKATASGKVKLVVKYSDSAEPGKKVLAIGSTSGYEELPDSYTLTGAVVSKIKLFVKHTSPSGKVYVDDVSLRSNSAAAARIPLP